MSVDKSNKILSVSSSIPSKYQRIVYLKDKLTGFKSSLQKNSFPKRLRNLFNREPGPGSYNSQDRELKCSKKGYTNGFTSQTMKYEEIGKSSNHNF